MEEGAADRRSGSEWDATVRAVNPEARFIPNGPPDLKTAGELAAIQFTDNQARRGLTPPWANGRRAKEYRSVMGRKPIGGIFSVGLEEPYRWKDSVQSEPEIRLWVAEGTANGMRPWVTKFSGVLYDRRWLPAVERIYQWHFENERYLRNEAPLARVALLHSEQTETYHPGVAQGDRAEDHVLGMYHALIEARVPFELVHEAFLTPDRLDQFRLLILADAAALSDAQCDAIRGYVKRGGSVLATFASSLFDEFGQRRDDFGLADVFGVSFDGRIQGPMQNSYLTLETDPATGRRHPILDGLDDTPRIINGVFRIGVQPTEVFPVSADAHPVVSGSADGGRLPARPAHRRARALPAHGRRQPHRLHPVGHRPHVLGRPVRRPRPAAAKRDPVGDQRSAAGRGRGPRRHRRDRLAAARVDDGAPRQPDEPDDDEGTAARDRPHRTRTRARSACPPATRARRVQLLTAKTHAASRRGQRRAGRDRAVDRRARGGGGGYVNGGRAQGSGFTVQGWHAGQLGSMLFWRLSR